MNQTAQLFESYNVKCFRELWDICTPEERAEIYKTIANNNKEFKLPEWLDIESWLEFEQHRKEIKKPLTLLAVKKNLAVLEKHQGQQKEIIDNTIANRWTGLFPPKINSGTQKKTADDYRRDLLGDKGITVNG